MSETEPLLSGGPVRRTWRHYAIFPILFLCMVCWVLQFFAIGEWTQATIKEQLIGNETLDTNISACSDTNKSDPDYLSYTRVEQETAKWQLYYGTSYSVTALLAMLILPSYSDRLGRKFLISISLSGSLFRWGVSIAVVYFKLHFIYIVIAFVIEGLTGAVYGTFTAAYAFVADVTATQAERSFWIAVLDGVISISVTTAGLGVGIYINKSGFLYPMVTGCAMSFLALLLTVFVLPETVSKEAKKKPTSALQTVRRIADFYTSNEFRDKRFAYIVLLLAFFFSNMSNSNRTSTETVYQLGKPFCWSSDFIGYFTAVRHAGQAFLGVGSVRLLRACVSVELIAIFSNISCGASFVLEAFATTELMMFMVPVVSIFSILAVPMTRSIMSYMTPADKQGALFAGIAVFDILGSIVSNFIATGVYAATVDFMQGFVFLVLAGMNVVALLMLWLFVASKKIKEEQTIN